jgi:hypothetical protein
MAELTSGGGYAQAALTALMPAATMGSSILAIILNVYLELLDRQGLLKEDRVL